MGRVGSTRDQGVSWQLLQALFQILCRELDRVEVFGNFFEIRSIIRINLWVELRHT